MLFSNSLRLVGIAAFLLPARLFVGASPHSLVRRAGPDIDLELNGFSSMDRDRRQVFPPVQLAPVGNYLYTVQGGGWNGQGAIAQHVALQTYLAWGTSGYNTLLAWGHDNRLTQNNKFYVIFKDQPLILNGFEAGQPSNDNSPQNFPEVNLIPTLEEVGKYVVVGGWNEKRATAKRLLDKNQYDALLEQQPPNLLAYGYDVLELAHFYAIFEDTVGRVRG